MISSSALFISMAYCITRGHTGNSFKKTSLMTRGRLHQCDSRYLGLQYLFFLVAKQSLSENLISSPPCTVKFPLVIVLRSYSFDLLLQKGLRMSQSSPIKDIVVLEYTICYTERDFFAVNSVLKDVKP